jgi:hypothetical protein
MQIKHGKRSMEITITQIIDPGINQTYREGRSNVRFVSLHKRLTSSILAAI